MVNAYATVLIVDDLAANRDALHELLDTQGYRIIEAADGLSALECAAAEPPDVILLDVMMPGMHGFEVCRRMRADPRLADVPVIMVTALDDHESKLAGIEAGADDFVTKPFNRIEMRARVRTITRLNRSRRLQETQAALRAGEERMRVLFELGPVAIYSCDVSGKILEFNRRAAALWGREPKLQDTTDLYCGSHKIFGPDGILITHSQCPMALVLLGTVASVEEGEVQIERPDGSRITVMVNIVPLMNDRKEIAGAINCFHDVTERKLSELNLRRTQKKFHDLFEFAPDAIVMTNAAGVITLVNRQTEKLFGYERGDLVGQPVEILMPESARQGLMALRANYLAAAGPRTMGGGRSDLMGRKKDGTRFPVEISLSPMDSDEGMLVVAALRDMTDRQSASDAMLKLEEQLRHTQKMDAIGQLAGGVAHDFNNQLSVIAGYGGMLKARLAEPKLKQYAESICKAADLSADLTKKLLAFARKGQYQTIPVPMHDIIDETIGMLSHTIDKRIEIKQDKKAASDVVLGDPSQLQNALLNLAVNARDAMPSGGKLFFETENVEIGSDFCVTHGGEIQTGSYVKIRVRDTGSGMGDEVKKHLFEPFFTTKPLGKGTGLGLASVYGTVKGHKGMLEVWSELGLGTTFTVYLPLAESLNVQKKTVKTDLSSATLSVVKNIRVLLVEDETELRRMVAEMLVSCDIECLEAENGGQAVETYAAHWQRVDLVILDMIMPEMNGPDAFRAMKKINSNIKVMLLTGFSLNNEVQAVLDEGAIGFVQKPFNKKILIDQIKQAVSHP